MTDSENAREHSLSRETGLMLALIAILVLGGAFRFYNVNWDKGTYHIHPDERHTTMVVTRIRWPGGLEDYADCRRSQGTNCANLIRWSDILSEYFDTSHSPLNPRNMDTVYFYGTLPLFLTKSVATLGDLLLNGDGGMGPPLTSYDQIHLVGRVLSAIFDLGSVLLLFFMARRLFDWRVGLVASFLLALTVLSIQGSHYFAVDTFLTFFVMLAMWFILDMAEGKGGRAFVGLGLSMGLTLACKVSVFLLAAVVALGAWVRIRRCLVEGHAFKTIALRVVAGLSLAVILALAVFRVAQPYAWAGPNYDKWDTIPEPWGERLRAFEKIPEPIRAVLMPNPQWIADIVSAGAQQTGEADLPWGRQWTERTPWLFPLENMVVWGMGVPLGTAAWTGAALVILQLGRAWRRRSSSLPPPSSSIMGRWDLIVIPLAWVLFTFVWQGMQFVKSIRYFLPIYPFLVAFAAYLVVSAWDWAKVRRRAARIAAGALAVLVLFGTLAWAWAFIEIYRQPVTRVQATRWMYENVESAATLHYYTEDGKSGQLQLPMPATHLYNQNGSTLHTLFTAPHDMVVTEVRMNNLTTTEGIREGAFEVRITTPQDEQWALTEAHITASFGGEGNHSHVLDIPDLSLTGGQNYYLHSTVLWGAPLFSQGSAIANEHFDDPLPFNMDGHIAFGAGPYRGLDLTLYDEDTPEKLAHLLDILDEADYISMSSGRLWQSIPRLPMRYPVTTRYYELLFAEELGFEKVAEFHSYPRLFGIEFDDTQAEEQFTVYDHPKVLIYRKTDEYDRARVEAMLTEGVEWSKIARWLNPRDVPEWRREQERLEQDVEDSSRERERQDGVRERTNDLMLTEEQRQVQEKGGTWAVLFDGNSLPNRWPTFSWLVLLGLLGFAALPLTLAVFSRLPDRGYILARPVGVLLLAWLSWMLTNLTPLHYSRGTILLALGLISVGSWSSLLLPGQRRRLRELWRTQKRLVLLCEILFLVLFATFWLIRWGNPDLWHAWKGGEKPMDFAYLNAVIKSTEFPPYDPWFAGGYLNYYYFGQVLVGSLIKLIGIVPSVAYNLVIPTWFAMTAMGAFSVTYNLVKKNEDTEAAEGKSLRPLLAGMAGILFVAILGNLAQVHLLLLKVGEGVMETFQSTIPGLATLVRTVIGAGEAIFGGRALPIGLDEWYWNASRAIPAAPYEAVITEFPFFTFLYADLHAHLIAMPLAFLALAVAIAVVRDAKATGIPRWPARVTRLALLLLWSLTIGAMRTTNTWDVPPHLLVALGALAIGEFAQNRRPSWRMIVAVVWQFGTVFLLSWWVLYWPFWAHYAPIYDSLGVWSGSRTQIWAYLVVHGLFLFLIVSYLSARTLGGRKGLRSDPLLRRLLLTIRYRKARGQLKRAARIVGVRGLPVGSLVWVALTLLVLVEILLLIPGIGSFTRANPEWVEQGAYAYRGLSVFALGLPLAILGLLLLFRREQSPTERLWTYLVLLALAMTLGVEVIVLEGDIARMNTVFKFYLQVWLMWGVAAAAALAWMLPRVRQWRSGRGWWLGALAILLLCAALYPPLAASAKIRDRFDTGLGPSLDGWDYMTTARYYDPEGTQYDLKWDLEAIEWLVDNVVGSPVILEGHAPEYRWGGRYSINTGLPTVLGWNWHQRQQRGPYGDQEVWARAKDIATIYETSIAELAESLLHQYNVSYIVVGPLERAYYPNISLEKFERMVSVGALQRVFYNDEVTIYQVSR